MRFKHIFLALGLIALPFLSLPAASQGTCKYIAYGAVLTPAQWQYCFAAKADTIGYVPVNKAGDTMLGKLTTIAPSSVAGFNIPPGLTPSSPVNGDVWSTSSGVYAYVNGSTVQFATSSGGILSGANGGTGVANTGKTITIGGNVSTGSTLSTTGAFSTGGAFTTGSTFSATGAFAASSTVSITGALSTSAALSTTGTGATTLAFGASTQTYTFPTTTATIARTDAGQTFTGANTFSSGTTFSSAITYGGVALSNAVTGTGNMVLSASPTFTGTMSGAAATLTGTLTTNVTGGGTQCAQVSNTGVLSGSGAGCGAAAPSAMMHLANNASIASNGVAQIIPLDTIDFDTAGICSAVSHVCTPTTAGKYRVTCRTQINGSGTLVASDNRAAISGRKNGSNTSVNFSNYAAGSGSGSIAEAEVNGIITVNGSSDTIGCWGSVSFNVFTSATFLGNGDNVMIINYVGP